MRMPKKAAGVDCLTTLPSKNPYNTRNYSVKEEMPSQGTIVIVAKTTLTLPLPASSVLHQVQCAELRTLPLVLLTSFVSYILFGLGRERLCHMVIDGSASPW